jgi:hypothetical protein
MGGRTDTVQPQSTWPAQMMPSLLQQQQQHRQHHELVRRSRAAVGSRGLHAAYSHTRQAIPNQGGWVG